MSPAQREAGWPYLAGLLVTAGWWFLLDRNFPRGPEDLFAASGTIASVLVGFLATAKAIIMSISSTATYQTLQSAGYDKRLMSYIRSAIYAGLLFLLISTLGFFVGWEAAESEWRLAYEIAWVGTGAIGLALYVRIIHLIFRVLEKV